MPSTQLNTSILENNYSIQRHCPSRFLSTPSRHLVRVFSILARVHSASPIPQSLESGSSRSIPSEITSLEMCEAETHGCVYDACWYSRRGSGRGYTSYTGRELEDKNSRRPSRGPPTQVSSPRSPSYIRHGRLCWPIPWCCPRVHEAVLQCRS
jgi:hypothetical protein